MTTPTSSSYHHHHHLDPNLQNNNTHNHHTSTQSSSLASSPNSTSNNGVTPIGVPIYTDTQRRKRYTIPIRPAPTHETLSSFLEASSSFSSLKHQNHKSNSNFSTTTTILVSGLPAYMSIPEMLHVLFYENDDDHDHHNGFDQNQIQEQNNKNQKYVSTTPSSSSNHQNPKNNENNNHNVPTSTTTTAEKIPNLFFRFLNNIRVCFGTEHGTISFLVTFFNDEDFRQEVPISTTTANHDDGNDSVVVDPEGTGKNSQTTTTILRKFVYSNAAREFFNRWHGQSAFPQAKEIVTVDFVDMDLMMSRELQQQQNVAEENSQNVFATTNFSSTTDKDGYIIVRDASSWWNFFETSFKQQKQQKKEEEQDSNSKTESPSTEAFSEPCPICLEEFSFSLNINMGSLSHEEDKNDQNPEEEQQEEDHEIESTTDQFYSQLFSFSPALELPCRHMLHANCFSSVSGDAPCPMCRFNCCEEAFAAFCSVCKMTASALLTSSSSSSAQQNNNNNQMQQQLQNNNSHHHHSGLWMCLVCGECFCTTSNNNENNTTNHRQSHFLSNPSHHLFIQSGGLRVWDATLDDFLHRILWNINKTSSSSTNKKEKQKKKSKSNTTNAIDDEAEEKDDHGDDVVENKQKSDNEAHEDDEDDDVDAPVVDNSLTNDIMIMNWATEEEDEAEREALQLESQMSTMENYYNDLLLDQLQAQEEYFLQKSRQEGIKLISDEISMVETAARNHVAAQWRYELKNLVHQTFVVDMKTRTKNMRHAMIKMKEELEVHQVMLVTANATREKYKKFLNVAAGGTSSSTTTTTSNKSNTSATAAAASATTTSQQQQQPAVAVARKPTTLAEVEKCIDEHPEVVALEKELEKLINEMTSM